MLDSGERSPFGALLRQQRLLAGLTQAALAERAGIAERTIQDLERGVAWPRRATVRRIVDTLAPSPEIRAQLEATTPTPRHRPKLVPQPSHAYTALDDRRNNLPIQPTALLGREREVAELRALLRDGARLVTLTGPGGVGKTRLAIEVAAALPEDFADGVFLVELASLSDPALVPSSIAQVLGVQSAGGRTPVEGLREYLRNRNLLLLLDNFEQIVAAGPVVANLLEHCPGLTVLATSREPLRLRGEREYAVEPLALLNRRHLPPLSLLAQNAAVVLFAARAADVHAGFALTEENAATISEICARLDGLPLAIELAAARIRLLTPQAMAERMERRLPLLTAGARDLPMRQQTLRQTIAWSYDLLPDQEQQMFRRLAVFVGGWSLEAVEAICNAGTPDVDAMGALESLASKSLIRLSADPDGKPRFGMLETIREYALERLGEGYEAACQRRRHATYYLAVAEQAEPNLHGPEQRQWLNRLEAEHDNLRAALLWTVQEEEAETGLRLAGALSHFWEVRSHHAEGRTHLTRVLQLPGTRVFPASQASVLRNLGFLAHDQGDYVVARTCHEESLAIMQGLGDRRGIARAQHGLAWVAFQLGDFAVSRILHEDNLTIMRELDDRRGAAVALNGLGYIAFVLSNHAEARAYHEESLSIMRDLGDRRNVARSLAHLGWAGINQRDYARARVLLMESLATIRELGDALELIRSLNVAVDLELAVDSVERAAHLQGAIDAFRDSIGAPVSPRERVGYEVKMAAMRVALGEPGFSVAWEEGYAMTQEQAVHYALEQVNRI